MLPEAAFTQGRAMMSEVPQTSSVDLYSEVTGSSSSSPSWPFLLPAYPRPLPVLPFGFRLSEYPFDCSAILSGIHLGMSGSGNSSMYRLSNSGKKFWNDLSAKNCTFTIASVTEVMATAPDLRKLPSMISASMYISLISVSSLSRRPKISIFSLQLSGSSMARV